MMLERFWGLVRTPNAGQRVASDGLILAAVTSSRLRKIGKASLPVDLPVLRIGAVQLGAA